MQCQNHGPAAAPDRYIVVGVAAIALFLTVNRKTVKALKAEVA
jgi:hypothetical protein